jgi:dTDP-4-dehydrorhamnose reductase
MVADSSVRSSRTLLVLGGGGQIGSEIIKRSSRNDWQVLAPDYRELDITREALVAAFIQTHNPSAVVNCAAYTAVDKAEQERERAYEVNALGARYVARGCSLLEVPLIHFSTDYVYPGKGHEPLREDAEVDPQNYYGFSKLEGERFVQEEHGQQSIILRTSSVFGSGGHNFVKTMLHLFSLREEVRVVADQIMTPTWAGWAAEVVYRILEQEFRPALLHCACAGALSWYDFSSEIAARSKVECSPGRHTKIIAIPASEYPTPAVRPMYSALDCSLLATYLGCGMMPWMLGLEAFLREQGYNPEGEAA